MVTEKLHSESYRKLLKERATELLDMVCVRHPDAHLAGPLYWAGEELWLFNAYFDDGEDFELEEKLSEREADILVDDDIWIGVMLSPLSAYTPGEYHLWNGGIWELAWDDLFHPYQEVTNGQVPSLSNIR